MIIRFELSVGWPGLEEEEVSDTQEVDGSVLTKYDTDPRPEAYLQQDKLLCQIQS